MKATVNTIHELLPSTRGNITELARILNCDRATLRKYIRDKDGQYHAVVNGKLMARPGLKPK